MVQQENSLLRIFLALIRSIVVGSFFAMSIGYPIIGTLGSPFGIIIALIIFAPLLPFIYIICVYLDRKRIISKVGFCLLGAFLGGAWGISIDLILYLLKLPPISIELSFFPYHFILVLMLTGLLSAWFYWRRMYSGLSGLQVF
jgi:hypothetical protein